MTVLVVWPGCAVRTPVLLDKRKRKFPSLKRAEEEDLSACRCAAREDVAFQMKETI